MYDTILVPIDGSDSIQPVVEDTAEFAAERDAVISLLYVVDERAFLTFANERVDKMYEELRSQDEAALIEAAETMAECGVGAATEFRHGDPAEEILVFAGEIDAALTSMGAHAWFEDNILESVSRSIVVQSKIPVLATPIERQ